MGGRDEQRSIRGYVLAGGGSTRFGQDKALVEFNGKPMLLQMCELIHDVVTRDVFVVGATSKYGQFGFECVADRWPGEGPLGGIVTAVLETAEKRSGCEWNLIVGCDMPFLNEGILVYCADRAKRSKAGVVVPLSPQGLEPLCACWRTSAASQLRSAFADGVRKVSDAMKKLQTEVIDGLEWKRFDTAGRLFWNMNTLADYREAQKVLQAGHK